jgi:hypothetical protein
VLGSDAGTGAEADGDGEIKRQKRLSTFRLATDDANGLPAP